MPSNETPEIPLEKVREWAHRIHGDYRYAEYALSVYDAIPRAKAEVDALQRQAESLRPVVAEIEAEKAKTREDGDKALAAIRLELADATKAATAAHEEAMSKLRQDREAGEKLLNGIVADIKKAEQDHKTRLDGNKKSYEKVITGLDAKVKDAEDKAAAAEKRYQDIVADLRAKHDTEKAALSLQIADLRNEEDAAKQRLVEIEAKYAEIRGKLAALLK